MKRRFFLFFLFLLLSGCTEYPVLSRTQYLMGTWVEIQIIHPQPRKASPVMGKAFQRMKELENLLSTYKEKSEVSLLNREGKIKASPSTLRVIKEALKFSRLSQGTFDPTVKPLVDLWKRARKKKTLPSGEEIQTRLRLVGWKRVKVKGEKIFFEKKGMKIDLGGIAKGFIVDEAVKVLKKEGIENALVNVGGDLYALGKGKGGGWKIGIRHPRKEGEIIGVLRVENQGVATSGDYERYFTLQGKRYSHLIDPRTGRTCQNIPASVTVIAPDSTTADALSTAIFVLGPEEGIKLVEEIPGVETLIILEDGRKFASSGINRWLEWLTSPKISIKYFPNGGDRAT